MEPNFQTSFIPKKPMVEEHDVSTRSVGIFPIASILILFIVILGTVGLFFYKGVLVKTIAEKEKNLTLARNRFEPEKITELQVLDKRLHAADEILSKHITITPIFEALSAITMKTVRYTNFSYSFEDVNNVKNGKVLVKMNGLAVGYRSVALQSDLFSTRKEGKNFINPIFSNLTLDARGNVLFDLEFSVDPVFVGYQQTLMAETKTEI